MRIGLGYDVHPFQEGRVLKLGGIVITDHIGLKGYSDADVCIHAVIDALLGAACKGDIGTHFPDTNPDYKNADSAILLKEVLKILGKNNYKVSNIDLNIHLETPRLEKYKIPIRNNIASLLGIEIDRVNIKAKTNEKLGFIGRGEGIAVSCIVLIE